MPEGRIDLAQAVIALALAPKSNAVIRAIGAATADVEAGRVGLVPATCATRTTAGRRRRARRGLRYAHDGPAASPPSSTCRTRWSRPVLPAHHPGAEAALAERLRRINELLGPE